MCGAIAGLHSPGKGANRTPPDAPSSSSPRTGCGRPVRRRRQRFADAFAVSSAGGLTGQGRGLRRDDHVFGGATRRDFLYIATGAVGAVGAAAVLVPLIAQMNPDASTIAAGAPIEVDLAPIAEGQIIKVFWRGKPIFISHRTKKEIEEAAERQRREPAGPAARLGARQGRPGAVAGR